MTRPFIIFSLPRSRSAWISAFLSYGDRKCGHDLATRCGSIAEFAGLLTGEYAGTAETGAVAGWRAILRALPKDTRIAVIRRPVAEIYASLGKFGIKGPGLMDMLTARDAMLDDVASIPGVKSFTFDGLKTLESCQALFEHCLDASFDWEWWEGLANVNIQVDVAEELRYQAENRDRIEGLKREAALVQPEIVIGPEKWPTLWPEIDGLFAEHFGEVEGELANNRPYRLDEPTMREANANGTLRIFSARVDGVLAGYCMWQVTRDVESAGMLIAQHGPWFVRPKFAHLRLGQKLFDASLDDLRAIKVQNAFPHHRLQGRGRKLGAFFRRRGAVETQRTYSLWLGEAKYA